MMPSSHRRQTGIRLSVGSLPSPYGGGSLGQEAAAFLDQIKRRGRTSWQIPIENNGSLPAGHPYWIDLDWLSQRGLLTRRQLAAAVVPPQRPVDPGHIRRTREVLLRQAYEQWDSRRGGFAGRGWSPHAGGCSPAGRSSGPRRPM